MKCSGFGCCGMSWWAAGFFVRFFEVGLGLGRLAAISPGALRPKNGPRTLPPHLKMKKTAAEGSSLLHVLTW